jgi:transcriptional regulator with XRE-family HTH domain
MATQTESRFIIGANMRMFRERADKSVADMCGPLKMSRAFWYDLEKGAKTASVEMLDRIAKALGVSVRDLLAEPKKRRSA